MFNKKYCPLTMMTIIMLSFIGCTDKKEEHTDEHHDEHSDVITLSQESVNQIKLETSVVSMQPFSGCKLL